EPDRERAGAGQPVVHPADQAAAERAGGRGCGRGHGLGCVRDHGAGRGRDPHEHGAGRGAGPGGHGAGDAAGRGGGPARVHGGSDAAAGGGRAGVARNGHAGFTVTPAGWAALDVLRSVRRGELADRALARAQERVSPRDRAWLQELVYGTLRLRGRLDHLLGQLVKRGLERLDPDVLDLLRLGAYQILEMQAVPVYAAVSQTVEAAKAVAGRGAGGLVNGVLHSLVRRLDELEVPDFDRDPVGYLVAW